VSLRLAVADDCIDHIIDELSGNPVLTHGGTRQRAASVLKTFSRFPRPLIVPPSDVQIVGHDFAILPFSCFTVHTAAEVLFVFQDGEEVR
jgi:hypothetical protein